MDNITAAIIGVLGALLGVWIGHKLSVKSSLDAINRQEFNRAAAEFRAAFLEAQRLLAKCYTYEVAVDKEKPSLFEILDKFFVDHERVVLRFRPYLSQDVVRGFDGAWEKYCCKNDWDIPLSCYSQQGGNDPEVEKEFMKRATTHLNLLLCYAKPMQD